MLHSKQQGTREGFVAMWLCLCAAVSNHDQLHPPRLATGSDANLCKVDNVLKLVQGKFALQNGLRRCLQKQKQKLLKM
jgi:hypothetical protein